MNNSYPPPHIPAPPYPDHTFSHPREHFPPHTHIPIPRFIPTPSTRHTHTHRYLGHPLPRSPTPSPLQARSPLGLLLWGRAEKVSAGRWSVCTKVHTLVCMYVDGYFRGGVGTRGWWWVAVYLCAENMYVCRREEWLCMCVMG